MLSLQGVEQSTIGSRFLYFHGKFKIKYKKRATVQTNAVILPRFAKLGTRLNQPTKSPTADFTQTDSPCSPHVVMRAHTEGQTANHGESPSFCQNVIDFAENRSGIIKVHPLFGGIILIYLFIVNVWILCHGFYVRLHV